MTRSGDRIPVYSGAFGRAAVLAGGVAVVAVLTVFAVACSVSGDTSGSGDDAESPDAAEAATDSVGGHADAEPVDGETAEAPQVGDPPGSAAASGADSARGADSADDTPAAVRYGDIPDVEMINVSSSATVNLRSLPDGERALLLWFWAPH